MASIKKNFVYQAMWQLLSMALPLVTSPILARSLGAEGIGIYTFVLTVVGYFSLAANLGVYRYGVQKISAARDDGEQCNQVFWEIWRAHSLVSLAVGGLYILFVVHTADYRLFYMIMGMHYLGSVLSIDWLFAGTEDFKKITIRDTAIKLSAFVLILLLIHDREDLPVYIFIMALGNLISGIVFWTSASRHVHKISAGVREVSAHIRGMFVLFIPVLIENVYTTMDKVMLGIMKDKTAVGFYENSEKALIAQRIIHALDAVIMPRMTYLIKSGKREEMRRLMKRTVDAAMVLSVAFGAGTAAISKEFSVIFWGEEFFPCARLIFVMALAIPAMGLSRIIRDDLMIPSGRNREYIACAGLGAVSNFVINLVFIPVYGEIVAAVSTFLSEFLVFAAQCIVIRKQIPVVQYIKEGCIYIPFGVLMYFVVRAVAGLFDVRVYALLIEVAAGMGTYIGICSIYWKLAGQTYYFDMIKRVLGRFFALQKKK